MQTKDSPTSKADLWKNATADASWLSIVTRALIQVHGPARLAQLYELIEPHPKTKDRKHWKAKVRQVLERSDAFVRIAPGTWDLSSQHSAIAIEKFDRERRERYPRGTDA